MTKRIKDCRYCEYASTISADCEWCDCYVEDFGYFSHHIKDFNEAKNCEFFEYCDVFPR